MRTNSIFKKIVALTCVITMLFSAIQLTAFADSNLTPITMEDFGIEDGLYKNNNGAGTVDGTYRGGDSLIGTVFTETLSFSELGHNRITYASLTDEPWTGIMIRVLPSGGIVIMNRIPGSGGERYDLTVDDIGVSKLHGVELEWKIELFADPNNADDALLGLYIDGKMCGDGYFSFANGVNILGTSVELNCEEAESSIRVGEQVHTGDSNLTPITMEDFGIEDGLYNAGTVDGTYRGGDSLIGTVFTETLSFSELGHNRITYASLTGEPWTGIMIRVLPSGDIVIMNRIPGSGEERYDLSFDDIGVSKLHGVELEWKIELFADPNNADDALLGLYIDGKMCGDGYFSFANGVNILGTCVELNCEEPESSIRVGEQVHTGDSNLTPITMEDFGIEDDLYKNNNGAGTVDGTYRGGDSLIGTVFTETLSFSELGLNRITYASLTDEPWTGIMIRVQPNGNIVILNRIPGSGGERYDLTVDDIGVSKLHGVELEWKIELFADPNNADDALLGLYIDGQWCGNRYFSFANGVNILGTSVELNCEEAESSIRVGAQVHTADQPAIYTMKDFYIDNELYGYKDGGLSVYGLYNGSLINSVLTTDITFSEHENNIFRYGISRDIPDKGICIKSNAAGAFEVYSDREGVTGGTYIITPESVKEGKLLGVDLEWQIKLFSDPDNAENVRLYIYINGKLWNDTYMSFTGGSQLGSGVGIGIEHTEGTVRIGYVVAPPANMTAITMEDFGIQDGLYKYNNGAGTVAGTYRGSDSLIGTVFTETLSFSELGLNRITYASLTDEPWTGIMIRVQPNGNIVILNRIPGSGQERYDLSVADIGVSKLHGEELEWKIELFADQKNAGDALLGLYIDGQLCGNRYFSFANGVNILGTSVEVNCEDPESSIRVGTQVHTADQPAIYTMKDFYIDNELYGYKDGGLSVYGLYNGSLINSVLTTGITFSEHENNIFRYGISRDIPDKGICIKSNADGEFEVYSDREGVTGGTYIITPESVQEEKLLGVDLEWQLKLFSDPDNAENVRLYIYINGKLWNDTYMSFTGGSQLGSGVSIGIEHTEGTVRIGVLIAPPANMTAITMKNFGVRDGLYKYNNGAPAANGSYYGGDSLIGTVLTQKMTFSEHAYNRITYASLTDTPWRGIVIRTEPNGNLAVINSLTVEGSNNERYTITPDDAGVEKFTGVELEWKIILFADPNNKADACLGIYINGTLCGNSYMTFANGVNIFGNCVDIQSETEDGTIQIGDLEAAPTIDNSFKQLRFSSYGIMSGVYTYNNDDLAAQGTCDLESYDRVVFSDVVNFSKGRGVSWFFGGKTSPWRGMTWSVTADGKLVVTERAFDRPDDDAVPFQDLVFESETAGVELVGRDVEITLSFEYVDSDFDGEKDDVKLGVWFDGKAYNNEWIYLKNTAKYLGSYMGIFSFDKDASMGIKTRFIPIDFTEFGFTSNWYAELGLGQIK